jgi:hypothetical protein
MSLFSLMLLGLAYWGRVSSAWLFLNATLTHKMIGDSGNRHWHYYGTKLRGTNGPFRNKKGRGRMWRMRAFLLPSFNIVYILACGAMAWFAVRRRLLR